MNKPILAVVLTGLWGVGMTVWSYPGLYDRLFIYEQVGDYEEVGVVLTQLAEQGETPLGNVEQLAELYLAARQPERVEQMVNEGQLPIDYMEAVIQAYLQVGQNERAFKSYRQYAEQVNTADTWHELAEAYLWKGYATLVEDPLLRAAALDPSPQRMFRLATFYQGRKNEERAQTFYQRAAFALEQTPSSEWAVEDQLLGLQIYDALGQTEDVVALLNRLPVTEIPSQHLNLYLYIALRAQVSTTAQSLFQAYLLNPVGDSLQVRFDYALFSRDPDLMRSVLEERERQGNVVEAEWEQLAFLYLESKQPEPIQTLLKQERLPISYWQVLGDYYFSIQQDEEGLAAYREQAIAINDQESWQTLVQLYFYKQQFAEGLATHRQQLAEAYNEPELWKELSDLYFWRGLDQQGEEALLKAIDLQPRLEWVLLLANYYERTTQWSQAEAYYKQFAQAHPQPKVGTLEWIRYYIRQSQFTPAIPLMRSLQQQQNLSTAEQLEALQLYQWSSQTHLATETLLSIPTEALPFQNLSTYFDLAVFGGRLEKAQGILDRWSRKPPPDFWQKQLDFALLRGRTQEAIALLQQALQDQGESVKLWKQLYAVYDSEQNQQGVIQSLERLAWLDAGTSEWLDRAMLHYDFYQEIERRTVFLTQLFAKYPRAYIRQALIHSLLAQQKSKEAMTLIQSTPTKQWNTTLEQLAIDVGYQMQNYEMVLRYLEPRYQRDQAISDLLALQELAQATNNTEAELQYMQEWIRRDPSFDNRVAYADLLYRHGYEAEGHEQLAILIKDATTVLQLQTVAGLAGYLSDASIAAGLYKILLERDPNHRSSLRAYGQILADSKQYPKAISVWQRYLAQVPEDPDILEQWLYLLSQEEQYETILQELLQTSAKRVAPEVYYQYKAVAESALNRRMQLLQTLQEWVQQFPDNKQAWVDLGYAYLAISDQDRAFEAFQRARQLQQSTDLP